MRIACYADLHGKLPKVVDCDLAVIAGDIGPYGGWQKEFKFFQGKFIPWMNQFYQAAFVAGNHDTMLQQMPYMLQYGYGQRHRYLEDDRCEMFINRFTPARIKVYGTPWTKTYGNPCFMESEEKLAERFSRIPPCDILISHGPPYGYGDPGRNAEDGTERPHEGSQALLDAIHRIKPLLVVCGHLHGGYGTYQIDRTTVVNAALVRDGNTGELSNEPIVIDL